MNEWNDVEEKKGILAWVGALSFRRKILILIYAFVFGYALGLMAGWFYGFPA